MELDRFVLNISWNVFGKICTFIASIAISILVSRYLGREALGIYATIMVIPALVQLLSSFGLETVLVKKISELKIRDEGGQTGRYLLQRVIVFRVITTLFFGILLYCFLPFYFKFFHLTDPQNYRMAIVYYFSVTSLVSLVGSVFMSYLQYKIFSTLEFLKQALNLIFIIIYIFLDGGIIGILYSYIISSGIMLLLYCYLARNHIIGESKPTQLKDSFRLAWVSYFMALFSFGLMTQSDLLMMNYFQVDAGRIGYYHLATGVSGTLTFFLAGIGPMALTLFSESFEKGSYSALSESWCQILKFSVFCIVPVYVFSCFYGEQLISFIYGDQFSRAGDLLSIYLVFLIISLWFGAGFAVQALVVTNNKSFALKTTIEVSILNIILNLILIPLYQEVGAIIATGGSRVLLGIRRMHMVRKQINVAPVSPFIWKCTLFSFVTLAITKSIETILFAHILLSVAVFALSFLSILALLKPLNEEHCRLAMNIHPLFYNFARVFKK